MEFRQVLNKLRFCDKLDRSLLTKEIIANIRHIQKTELIHILELLQTTTDMDFQVKVLLILSACLLYNNTNRAVLIKCSSLYDMLHAILVRGLQMKSAITLNFIALLLYNDEVDSRSRTLTLHAQNMLRNSGCLTIMSQLFSNYMLYSDTWKALCRCVSEVCHGSEINQTFCSHLVPLCVQKCHQGNLDGFSVLHSLLYNHKRNTTLFMETEGMTLFNRKAYLRYETCLQLLNTVIHNVETETLRILASQYSIHESLQNCLMLNSSDSRVSQWAKINIYNLESKLKERNNILKQKNIKQNDMKLNNKGPNLTYKNDLQDENLNNTQMLFQKIMTEIISYPYKSDGHNPWALLNKVSDVSDINRDSKINDITMHSQKHIKVNCNKRYSFHKSRNPLPCPEDLYKEQLSFSFLMKDKLKDIELNRVGKNGENTSIIDSTILDSTVDSNQRKQFCHNTTKSYDEEILEFKPAFVSTPIRGPSTRRSFLLHKTITQKNFSNRLRDRSVFKNHTGLKTVRKRIPGTKKDSVKQKSMSSRFLEAINESCTTFIKSFKNVFTGNKNKSKEAINIQRKKDDKKSMCSYSFTKYMQKRQAELDELNAKLTESNEMSTNSADNTCTTCNDTFLLKQKLAIDDQLKLTVKKLKFGINLYGCDFKKISKTMWPRETYMTPSVLYNLYRKLILK